MQRGQRNTVFKVFGIITGSLRQGYYVCFALQICLGTATSVFSLKRQVCFQQFLILSLPLTASTFGAEFSRLKVLRIHLCTHTCCVCAFEGGRPSQKHLKGLLGSSAENHFQNVQKDGKLLVLCCILFVSTKQLLFYTQMPAVSQ